MADETTTAAAAELTLTQKLEAALARIAELETAAKGPPPPPTLQELNVDQLLVSFLDGVHVLTGSHPSIDPIWQELRARILHREVVVAPV